MLIISSLLFFPFVLTGGLFAYLWVCLCLSVSHSHCHCHSFILSLYAILLRHSGHSARVVTICGNVQMPYEINVCVSSINKCPRQLLNRSVSRPGLIHVPACVNFDFPGLLNPLKRGAGGQWRQVKNTACFPREP